MGILKIELPLVTTGTLINIRVNFNVLIIAKINIHRIGLRNKLRTRLDVISN